MTVSSDNRRKSYSGDDATVAFPTTFKFTANADVKVILLDALGVETTLSETTHYTLAGAGDTPGGTVTMLTPPATGEILTILRDMSFTQLVDYLANDTFPAETHEGALDKLVMIVQQLLEIQDRAITLTESSQNSGITMPDPVAEKYLRWNSAGTALENQGILSEGLLAVSTFIETLLDDATSLEARATLDAAALTVANTFTENNTFTKTLTQKKGTDAASASALALGDGNIFDVTAIAAPITGATQANPVVITAVAHGLSDSDTVTIADVVGMTELNGNLYTVANKTDDTFELSGINGTGFTAYISGGSIWASITSIATKGVGTFVVVQFDGELALEHHAANLILQGAANITTAARDVALLVEYATGDWYCISYSRAAVKPINQTFRGALVGLTADQTIATATPTVINWDTETYDTDAFHDNVTNKSRFTVPADADKIRVTSGVEVDGLNGTTNWSVTVLLDGVSTAAGLGHISRISNASAIGKDTYQVQSAVIDVAETNYLEVSVLHAYGSDRDVSSSARATWFAIEVIE